MHTFAEKFASEHKLSLPFAVDKDPKLIALVNADKDLGTEPEGRSHSDHLDCKQQTSRQAVC